MTEYQLPLEHGIFTLHSDHYLDFSDLATIREDLTRWMQEHCYFDQGTLVGDHGDGTVWMYPHYGDGITYEAARFPLPGLIFDITDTSEDDETPDGCVCSVEAVEDQVALLQALLETYYERALDD